MSMGTTKPKPVREHILLSRLHVPVMRDWPDPAVRRDMKTKGCWQGSQGFKRREDHGMPGVHPSVGIKHKDLMLERNGYNKPETPDRGWLSVILFAQNNSPQDTPVSEAGTVIHNLFSIRALLASASISIVPGMFFSTPVVAAGLSDVFAEGIQSSGEIMMMAIFMGAMTFALLSAYLMIRERGRIQNKNRQLRDRISLLRANNERLTALVSTSDQKTVVWNGYDERPVTMGKLRDSTGAPDDDKQFLAFGSWLKQTSFKDFETSLNDLKQSAASFDLTLETRTGSILEAQGRTSGGHAFVRFIELGSERAALASLEREHSRLMSVFDSIQSLFENINIPVWLKDPRGNLIWVNSAYAAAVEAENAETATKQNLQMLDRADMVRIDQHQAENPVYHDTLSVIVAGDQIPLEVTDVKSCNGTAGLAINKQELRVIKAEFERTRKSHSQTLDQLTTAIAIFDKRQRLQFYNSSFNDLWKLDEDFLQSNPDNGEVLDALRAGKRLPETPDWRKWRSEQLEVYRHTETKTDWWYLVDGQTIRVVVNPDAQGGTTWIFEDVTEEMALKSSYNSLVRVQGETLDHLNEAVAVFGSDGLMKFSNSAFDRFWKDQDIEIGKTDHIRAIVDKVRTLVDDTEPLEDILSYITSVETIDDLRGNLELADDTIFDYSLVSLPDGQSMLTLVDVTARVNVERALQDRNDALMESDRIKTRFIQHVSYELRVPLTTILGYGQMMEKPDVGKLNHTQTDYIGNINISALELKQIVDNILDLASVDAGTMDLYYREVDVESLIDNCVSELQEPLEQHFLTVKKDIGEDARIFSADEARFAQIINNLLSNAANFSPDGGTIVVATRREDEHLQLILADDGIGIPEEYRSRIFESFESGIEFRERRKGAGLGLTIVKSFVELHGGTVSVTDAKPFGLGGACFICSFPADGEASQIAAE